MDPSSENPTSRSAFEPDELARQLRFSDVAWLGHPGRLVWLEQRSDRGVLVTLDPTTSNRRDLTTDLPVRAGWGYGGGDFAVGRRRVYFLSGGRLFSQALDEPDASLLADEVPRAAAPSPSPDGQRLLLVVTPGATDHLELLSADGIRQRVVERGRDFVMQPVWRPDGECFCWVGWDHPNMPWDGTGLYVASVSDARPRLVAGEPRGSEAIFQPSFSPDGRWLSYVSDARGWSNLTVVSASDYRLAAVLAEDAEHAPPAWVQGIRSYVWHPDSSGLFLIRSSDGYDELVRFRLESASAEVLALERWTALSQPAISTDGRLALVASSPAEPATVIVVDPETGAVETVRSSLPERPRSDAGSRPRRVQWESEGGTVFGLFHEPIDSSGPPAAVLRAHGGPTSQYRAEFEPEVQFFTRLGLAVLDVNYRGSSGYGRAYRRCLDGRWGELDVADLCSAAGFLIEGGLADRERLVASGGSAGGLTVLLALARRPGLFAAGICRYPVSDLVGLARETHRFEQHYLDSLVGRWPEAAPLYLSRSPLECSAAIRDPVALFQGGEDRVVPARQTRELAERLAVNGTGSLFRLYPDEGHGWRRSETIADYYRTLEKFLAEVLRR